MKKKAIIVLCLTLVLTLIGCGNNAQSSDEHNAEYEESYTAGYEAGYHDGEEQATGNEKHFAQFSGSFTATVEQIPAVKSSDEFAKEKTLPVKKREGSL